MRSGDHVKPLPRNAARKKVGDNRRANDGSDSEEPFHGIHGCRVLGGRRGDITDQRERAGLKNADCRAGNRKENDEERETNCQRRTDKSSMRTRTKSQDDGFLSSQLVRQIAKKERRERDPGHRGVVKGAADRHAEVKFFDDFRNDDADRIGRHGEHHEHEECQPLDYGQNSVTVAAVLFMRLPSVEPLASLIPIVRIASSPGFGCWSR